MNFFCPNKICIDYGKKNNGNIRVKDHYGKNRTVLLVCKTCKKSFSETRGTIFFRLHTPKEKVLPPDLKYAQIVKHKENDEVVSIEKRVVFGNEEELLNTLEQNGNTINTSYVERNNLTARNGVSRLIRDTINFSKCFQMLTAHVCFFFAWFNFVKPHDALKIEIDGGIRRWKQRTPAMAANITDHIWTLEEFFNVKPPPDR